MSTEQKYPTPAPSATPAPAYSYPPQQMPQQPMGAAHPGQQVVYDAQGNAYMAMAPAGTPNGAPGIQHGQPMMHPPPMVYPGDRRNPALVQQYEKDIRENEIGGVEICWFLCCGFFGLICCLPKYNAGQEAKTKLQIELAKPA
ncbi:hypothetical protein BGZ88_000611 [Linnemannia elongata]|uniref:Uncharacterized protein n=1 Tax=Linnemannia elongata AG-77 TaxID=1314771 RepID=A0A197KHE2_9FUNG|nr:hypothetical protein BGZ88_000611 [Linnemannia elongata]KAG0072125.1 hypothetical protein BGZ89_008022 [Linnemannia elongata]OAQ36071.1 hypothetical protein K457DRAFT_132057 [Linnemannia elongata AG-77]